MIMTEPQALGHVLRKRPKVGTDTVAAGLQGFKPGPLGGCMDAHTLCRTMIYRDTDGHLDVLPCEGGGHIGPPHRSDTLCDERPIMGFRPMGMTVTRCTKR